jgi:hypothetical protein
MGCVLRLERDGSARNLRHGLRSLCEFFMTVTSGALLDRLQRPVFILLPPIAIKNPSIPVAVSG